LPESGEAVFTLLRIIAKSIGFPRAKIRILKISF